MALRTRFAGDPLSQWSGPLPRAAGLCAAVAETLADLHDLGLVHGRLDATHVLVGPDGRPRLCGLSDPGPAEPADDVRALGRLLDDLVARSDELRRSSRPWPRGSAGDRRALAQVAARALDPVPARRPTARALARSIVAALPAAELPPATEPTSAAEMARVLAPWLTRVGALPGLLFSDAARRRDQGGGRPPGGVGDASSLRDGRGSRPAAQVGDASRPPDERDNRPPGRAAEATGLPHDDEPDAWPNGPTDPAGGAGDPTEVSGQPDDTTEPFGAAGRATSRWPVVGGQHEDDTQPLWAADPAAPTPTSPLPRLGETRFDPAAARDRRAGRAPHQTTRRVGSGQRRRRPGAAIYLGSACMAGIALVAGTTVVHRTGAAGHGAPPTAGEAPHTECPTATPPAADTDADGCPGHVAVAGRVVETEGARWSLGEAGDLAAVGDWDCDGSASPALVRPETGDVFVFAGWAPAGQPLTVAARDSVGPGAAAVRAARSADGCDDLVVTLPRGEVTVEVGR